MADADAVVVGAGVIGLAVAAELARAGLRVVILERHAGIARETTSRNSQVVHAGIYYPPGSLKAEFCRSGREDLYARCAAHGIPHRKIGKLIVANGAAETQRLASIHTNAAANDVPLEWLDAAQVSRLEPDVSAEAALLSPQSGIVDAHAYALSFLAEAEAHGAVLALLTDVIDLDRSAQGWHVTTRAGRAGRSTTEDVHRVHCRAVVNAAGLSGDHVAALAGIDVDAAGYRLHLCKGDYFALVPTAPISLSHLVYPIPGDAGLGIHATLDLGGQVRFGPDTEFVDEARLEVAPDKARQFAAAAARYVPKLRAEWLSPDYAGLRPKLAGAGAPFSDFVVREESERGLPGLVSCVGIESPGLTAASSIARRVGALLELALDL